MNLNELIKDKREEVIETAKREFDDFCFETEMDLYGERGFYGPIEDNLLAEQVNDEVMLEVWELTKDEFGTDDEDKYVEIAIKEYNENEAEDFQI